MAPPSTFDIYMQNQSVRPSTQGTWNNPFSQTTGASSAMAKTTTASMNKSHGFEISSANLANPHLDFSLRLAMQTTFDGTQVKKAKAKKPAE